MMQHFSCDVCGKNLLNALENHFVVKMEVYAAQDPAELTEEDLDADHLEEISEILTDDGGMCEPPAASYQKMRFDLCTACQKRFLADPLGREAQKFDFSEN